MSEADGVRSASFEIINEAILAAGNGAAAMSELNNAISLLKAAKETLKGSRAHALQELEQLIGIAAMTERLLFDSNNIDVMGASHEFRQAASDVELYSNRVIFTVDKLNQVIGVLEKHRRDQELDASGLRLRKGVEHIQNYRIGL